MQIFKNSFSCRFFSQFTVILSLLFSSPITQSYIIIPQLYPVHRYNILMSQSLSQVSLSASIFQQTACIFCQQPHLCFPLMICSALFQKHLNRQDLNHLKDLNDVVDDRMCEPTVRFLEMLVLADEDQFLKREYKREEYNRKITALGEYYMYHRDIPRFHAMPVELVLGRYYDRRREWEYKKVKRIMREEQGEGAQGQGNGNGNTNESMGSMSQHSSYLKKSKYSTMLEEVKKSFQREERKERELLERKQQQQQKQVVIADQLVEKSESVALFEIYDKLNEIVKAVPEIPEMSCSYLQNSGVRNFENWIKKTLHNKKPKHVTIQENPEPNFLKKKGEFDNSGSKKKLLLKYHNRNSIYSTLNMDYKKILQTKHQTAATPSLSSWSKTNRPLLKMSQNALIPPPPPAPHQSGTTAPLKADKQKSLQKIYGMDSASKPIRAFQRVHTADKRYQQSNRFDIGSRSKSIDRLTIQKLVQRAHHQHTLLTKQQTKRQLQLSPKRNARSVSRTRLQKHTFAEQKPTKLKNRKSQSVPSIKHDIRIGRPKPMPKLVGKASTEIKRPQKRITLEQMEMVERAVERRVRVDPSVVYKKLRDIS